MPQAGVTRRDGGTVTLIAPVPKDPDAADKVTIAELRRAGSDVSRPAHIIHYLYIPAERDAREAAAALRRRGFNADVYSPLGKLSDGTVSKDWGVLADTTGVPSLANLRKARR